MAASFTAASSQRIRNSLVATIAAPVTVGFWFLPFDVATTQTLWALSDTGTTNNFLEIGKTTTQLTISAQGGGIVTSQSIGTLVANTWNFALGRFASTTNRRLSLLQADGGVANVQSTLSRVPTGIDCMSLGCREASTPTAFYGGLIGEFWYANIDIQADGGIMDKTILLELAFGGPFSVDLVKANLLEYRSLRKWPSSDGDDFREVMQNGLGVQSWANVNGVTIGPHVPLPQKYRELYPARKPLVT